MSNILPSTHPTHQRYVFDITRILSAWHGLGKYNSPEERHEARNRQSACGFMSKRGPPAFLQVIANSFSHKTILKQRRLRHAKATRLEAEFSESEDERGAVVLPETETGTSTTTVPRCDANCRFLCMVLTNILQFFAYPPCA